MKQISDGETTTSSRPAFRGLTAASVMVVRFSLVADGNGPVLPHAPRDFKAALPYTAGRARARSRRRRLLRPPPDQRDAGARGRARPRGRAGPAPPRGPVAVGPGSLRRPAGGRGARAPGRDRS